MNKTKNNFGSIDMKNVVAYLILLLETIGIIAASVIYANKASMHSAINIQVPDGMQLTLSKEIEIDTADGSIVLSEGTVVTPEYIFPHDVHFQYEGMNQRIHADWDNFKEKQQLEAEPSPPLKRRNFQSISSSRFSATEKSPLRMKLPSGSPSKTQIICQGLP